MNNTSPVVFLLFLSCIGTDIMDDPIVGKSLQINRESIELLIGQTESIDVIYKNEYGIEKEINPTWISSNPNIASVSSQGLVTAIDSGQAFIHTSMNGLNSDTVMITVVASESSVARVSILATGTSQIEIGDSLILNSEAYNINNQLIDSAIIIWNVDNPNIATINQNGLLKGLSSGMVEVKASSSGVESLPLQINVGMSAPNILTGTFMGANGYTAEGTAELSKNVNDELVLTLQSDFKTSFALGTFIYLANSTSGSSVRGSGLELGEISANGMKTFNVSAISPNTELETYRYVVVLCKPASITFGIADFQN